MMLRSAIVCAVFALASGMAWSEEPAPEPKAGEHAEKKAKEEKAKPERLYAYGPTIEALKAAGMTDDELAKAKEAVAAIAKKELELSAKPEVVAAKDELKKAQEAAKAAEAKLKAAMEGFDPNQEMKKAVYESVAEDKKAKVGEAVRYNPPKKKAEKAEKPEKAPKHEKAEKAETTEKTEKAEAPEAPAEK